DSQVYSGNQRRSRRQPVGHGSAFQRTAVLRRSTHNCNLSPPFDSNERGKKCSSRRSSHARVFPSSQLVSRKIPMSPTAVARSSFEQLRARIREARAQSDELFEIVRPEALYDRPIPERHRIIFYLGHLEAFDWNLLLEPIGLSSFDPDFDKLFAFGIDPVEGGLPTDQPKDWPSVGRVRDYNKRLREQLNAAIRTASAEDPSLARLEHGRLIEVAIEHRLMHSETLCYMLHQLPVDRKFGQPTATPPSTAARDLHC